MHELFFNLLLIFLPTQLGLHFWPEWTMVLGRRIDYLSPTIYGTDILILCVLISWFVDQRKKFLISNFQFLNKQRNIQFLILKILLVFGFVGANIYFSASPMVALAKWLKVLEYILLGLYVLKTKPKFSSTIFYLSIGVFYSSVIAIVQFVLQRSIGGPLWFLGERTFTNITPGIAQFNLCKPFASVCTLLLRSYGTFPHPNVLAGFLAVMLPLISNLQIDKSTNLRINKKTFQIYKWMTFSLGVVALILTFSRSAWIAAMAGIIFIVLKKRFFIPVLALSIVMLFFIAGTLGFQDESVVVRSDLNSSAITMFRESPIIGKGLGNFLVELPRHLLSRQIYFLQPVHNIYLLVLTETGIIGAAIFLWTIWKSLQSKNKSYTFVLYRVSFIVLLLLGLIDHYPLTLQQGQLMFTIFLSLSLMR